MHTAPHKPKKSLGQHFLTDLRLINRIVQAVQLAPQDCVIEIGPGTGQLTRHLAKHAGAVYALEIDSQLCRYLGEKLGEFTNLEIIQANALDFNYQTLFDRHPGKKFKLAANLPYYVATPILQRLSHLGQYFEYLVVMIQQEVALRLTSPPATKAYGGLTLAMQYHVDIKYLFDVPRQAFHPPPKVESAVIRLTPWNSPPVTVPDEALLFDLIKAAFSQRRKTLYNTLRQAAWLEISPEKIGQAIDALKLAPKVRGEELSLENFAELTRICHQLKSQNP